MVTASVDRSFPPVRRAGPVDLAAVYKLDERACPGRDRSILLRALAAIADVYVHKDGSGRIDGVAIHTHLTTVTHVGPVIAPSDDIACALVAPALRMGDRINLESMLKIDEPLAIMLQDAGVKPDPGHAFMVRNFEPVDVKSARNFVLAGGATC